MEIYNPDICFTHWASSSEWTTVADRASAQNRNITVRSFSNVTAVLRLKSVARFTP